MFLTICLHSFLHKTKLTSTRFIGVASEALRDWPGKFFLSFLSNYEAKHEIIVKVLGIMTRSSFCLSRCAFESKIEGKENENREQFLLPMLVLRVKNRFVDMTSEKISNIIEARLRQHARSIICSCLTTSADLFKGLKPFVCLRNGRGNF